MREILFKGKSKIDGKWKHGLLSYSEQENKCYIGSTELLEPIFIESTCEFTGLIDKNGKKIFEGDIVCYFQPYSKTTHEHIVKWDTRFACFGLFEDGNEWCKESDWMKIQDIEIIGNIHDNPELINHNDL